MEPLTRPVMNYPDSIDPLHRLKPDRPVDAMDTASMGYKVNKPEDFGKTTVPQILDIIRSDTYKTKIEAIRRASDIDKARKLKFALPWFSLCRFISSRKNTHLSQANGMILDYDLKEESEIRSIVVPAQAGIQPVLKEDISNPAHHPIDGASPHTPENRLCDLRMQKVRYLMREILPKLDWVRFAFTSPSGGLKIGIGFQQPLFREPDYKMVYLYIQEFADNLLGIKSDATPDPARATFFSWDPELYDNPDARLIDTDNVLNQCISKEVEAVNASQSREGGKPASTGEKTQIVVTEQVLKDVDDCISYLSRIKTRYHDWIKVGMALYAGLGESGKKHWDRFFNNPHYYYETQQNLDKHWKSFSQVKSITLASLFYVAEQYGWINPNPPSAPANVQTEETPEKASPLKRLESGSELVDLFGKPANVELDIDMLPAVLQDYLAFTDTVTDAQSGAKLTAFLPCIAANIGNRVYMVNNSARIFPHIWGIIIGPSSISRKTTVIKLAKQTLEPYEESLNEQTAEDYLKNTLIMTDVTMSKLLQMLSENPNRVFIQMEVSAWMRQMNRHWNAGMKQALTDLFDGVDKTIANMDRTERIRKPAFSIIAASTEGWFFQEMKEVADQQSGFMQRFLFCLIQNVNVNEIDLSYREGQENCPELRRFEEMFSVFRSIPGHFKLGMDEEAKALRNEKYKSKFEEIATLKNDALMSYFARIYDGYFFKFCIIFHLLKNWQALKEAVNGLENNKHSVKEFFNENPVKPDTIEQALTLCDFYYENTKPLLDALSESNKLQNERKLVSILHKSSSGSLPHSTLLNRSHLNKREFKDAIESLIERNALSVTTTPSKNQYQAKTYVLSQEIMESWHSTSHQ